MYHRKGARTNSFFADWRSRTRDSGPGTPLVLPRDPAKSPETICFRWVGRVVRRGVRGTPRKEAAGGRYRANFPAGPAPRGGLHLTLTATPSRSGRTLVARRGSAATARR